MHRLQDGKTIVEAATNSGTAGLETPAKNRYARPTVPRKMMPMTPNEADAPRTTDDEYVRRVLKYRPSSLVPWIARVGAQYSGIGSWESGDYMRFNPWALSDIARISLVGGSEFLRDATRNDLLQCADDYRNLLDPELGTEDDGAAASFLLRIGYEQLLFRQSLKGEIARNIALFEQTQPSRPLAVIKPGWDQELLGCSLSQYAGIGFCAYAVATQHRGQFATSWFGDPSMGFLTSHIPLKLMRDVLDHEFTGDRDYYRSFADTNTPSPYRRFDYNPLLGRPVVRLNNRLMVPVALQVIRKISPVGLWYAGFDRWGNSFAEDVGDLFEQYVGRVLRTIPDAQVHPEIIYDPKGNKRSVDWIVQWDNVVLLVEVKSTRATQEIRMGTAQGWADLNRRLGHAYTQLETTADLIESGHSKFAHIPKNLPRIGLILTMEPFPFIDGRPIRDMIGVAPSVPTRVCSISDLEWLACLPDRCVGDHLLTLMTDPAKDGWEVLGHEFAGVEFASSEVLDQAWSAFAWSPGTAL